MPSRLGNLLAMKTSSLEKVIYFQDYVVIDPGNPEETKLQEKQLTYQKLELAVSKRAVEDQRAITDTSAAEIIAAEKELRGDWDKRLQTATSENIVAIAAVAAEANIYDQQTRTFVPVYGERSSARPPPFFSFDIRLDKTYTFRKWKLGTYLDLQNATVAQNVEVIGFTYDYGELDPITSNPPLPVFGLKGEW